MYICITCIYTTYMYVHVYKHNFISYQLRCFICPHALLTSELGGTAIIRGRGLTAGGSRLCVHHTSYTSVHATAILYVILFIIYIYIYIYIYIHTSFSCRYWLRRPVHGMGAGFAGNAYSPARAGFAGDVYTPANEAADDTTWRNPYGAPAPEA